MRITSLDVGRPAPLELDGDTVQSAMVEIERNEDGVSVLELNRLVYVDTDDVAGAERALAAGGVSQWWRVRLRRNLARAGRADD